jgi:hypothetical protein
MPLFSYSLTRGNETRTTQLRKSNPQGWLLQAVNATFPDVASRRGGDIMRLRLQVVAGVKQTWRATLTDEPSDLLIQVTQSKA